MVGKIFISYRRGQTSGDARSIYQRLVPAFGAHRLFMDVDTIQRGRDFQLVLDEHLHNASAMLVIIGKDWLNVQDGSGRHRLSDPNDFVRLEIATALKRGIPVVPVLVDGAPMPGHSNLPDDLAALSRFQGITIRHENFASDTAQLIDDLKRLIGVAPQQFASKRRGMLLLTTGIVAGTLALGGWWLYPDLVRTVVHALNYEPAKRELLKLETADGDHVQPKRSQPPLVKDLDLPPSAPAIDPPRYVPTRDEQDRILFRAALDEAKKGNPGLLQEYLFKTCDVCAFRKEARLRLEDLETYVAIGSDDIQQHEAYLARPNTDNLEAPFPLMAEVVRHRLEVLKAAMKQTACIAFDQQTRNDRTKVQEWKCPKPELWGPDMDRAHCMSAYGTEAFTELVAERTGIINECKADQDEAQALAKAIAPTPLQPQPKSPRSTFLVRPTPPGLNAKACLPAPPEVIEARLRYARLLAFLKEYPNGKLRPKGESERDAARKIDDEAADARWAGLLRPSSKSDEFRCFGEAFPNRSDAAKNAVVELAACEAARKEAEAAGRKQLGSRSQRAAVDIATLKKHNDSAKLGLCKSEFEGRIARERDADGKRWADVAKTGETARDYERYVDDFPSGQFVGKAKEAIADLVECEDARYRAGVTHRQPERVGRGLPKAKRTTGIEALRGYLALDKEKFTRCREEFARLTAPPESLKNTRMYASGLVGVGDVSFSPDSTAVLVASAKLGTILRWELATGKVSAGPVATEPWPANSTLLFSPDGRFIIDRNNTIRVRVSDTLAVLQTFPDADPAFATWSDSGKLVVAGTRDGRGLGIWETESGRLVRTINFEQQGARASRISVSDDGSWLATRIDWSTASASRHEIQVWNVKTGRLAQRLQPRRETREVVDLDPTTLKEKKSKQQFDVPLTDLAFTKDSSRFFVTDRDGRIDVRAITKGVLSGNATKLDALAVTIDLLPNGSFLLRDGHAYSTLPAWSKPGDGPVLRISSTANLRRTPTLSADGRFFAGTDGQRVWLWDQGATDPVGWLVLGEKGDFVAGRTNLGYVASESGEAMLSVTIGKRKWPASEVQPFTNLRKTSLEFLALRSLESPDSVPVKVMPEPAAAPVTDDESND